jgi:hypothetical protein
VNPESGETERFWREKEKEHGSALLISTPAELVSLEPDSTNQVSGLLYIMQNGIYFETFNDSHFFGMPARPDPNFKKVNLGFKREQIVGVSCSDRFDTPLPLLERFLRLFFESPRHFTVTFIDSGHERSAIFNCLIKPHLLCDAYDSMCR